MFVLLYFFSLRPETGAVFYSEEAVAGKSEIRYNTIIENNLSRFGGGEGEFYNEKKSDTRSRVHAAYFNGFRILRA